MRCKYFHRVENCEVLTVPDFYKNNHLVALQKTASIILIKTFRKSTLTGYFIDKQQDFLQGAVLMKIIEKLQVKLQIDK